MASNLLINISNQLASIFLLTGVEIYEEGVERTKNIAAAWDQVWQKVLLFYDLNTASSSWATRNLYSHLCYVGLVFASGLLIFYAIKQFKDLKDGNYEQYFLGLFFPLLVVFLLSNGGVILADLTYDLRGFINEINIGVLDSAVEGVNLDEAYRELREKVAFDSLIPNLHSQCKDLTGQELSECFSAAVTQSESLNPEKTNQGSRNVSNANPWSVLGVADDADENASTQLVDPNYYNRAMFTTMTENAAFIVLNSFQSGYQQLLEGSLLLTGLIGPIAVGGSLLFNGTSTYLIAWLTGFFSIGFAKLAFNIVAGLAAVAATIAGPSDPLPLATITGFFAPVLSAALATGGGLAVWQGMTGAAEGAIGLVARFVGNFF
ncbi:MAG: hypothetical protein QNJ37_08720 [Crocosphaera sp.]|nr:hypothetical protein [Crocosphaera sp.]